MGGTFSQLTVIGSSLTLVCALILLWRRRVSAYIVAFQWQSGAIAAVTLVVAHFAHEHALYVVAVVIFVLKALAIPHLLRRMDARFGAARELAPYLNTATSLIVSGGLVVMAYIVMRPLVAVTQLPTRAGLPLAMGVVFVSLFVMVSRKKALTQIVGFLMLENGVALLAVLGTYGIPLVVELGVFLDLLMGFLVMQVFVYRIHETFEHLDVEQLSDLRH
jgi:hydrogenase-4 component E